MKRSVTSPQKDRFRSISLVPVPPAKPTSDFDFVIDADERPPGKVKVINPLREALEQLRVPYTIDLVDWHRCSEAFRVVAGPQRVEVV